MLVRHAVEALGLALALSLPVLLVAGVVGVLVAVLQATTQLHDPAVAHLARFLAVAALLAALGPSMARALSQFAERMLLMP
ncbi:MAG: flagellar biosynthetic protein FliQ [Myxococcales bacterium]|jgi:type III secretory pathway component EscS